MTEPQEPVDSPSAEDQAQADGEIPPEPGENLDHGQEYPDPDTTEDGDPNEAGETADEEE